MEVRPASSETVPAIAAVAASSGDGGVQDGGPLTERLKASSAANSSDIGSNGDGSDMGATAAQINVAAGTPPPPTVTLLPVTKSELASSSTQICRLCAKEVVVEQDSPAQQGAIDIFSEEGKRTGLPEKCSNCLPVLITESDDLSKYVCSVCVSRVNEVSAFFASVTAATHEQVSCFRKRRGSPLDLNTHIHQYVRSFLPPPVPHIKMEPGALDGVDFNHFDEGREGEGDVDDGYYYGDYDEGGHGEFSNHRKRDYGYKLDGFVVDEDDEDEGAAADAAAAVAAAAVAADDGDSQSDEDWKPPPLDGFGRMSKRRRYYKSESEDDDLDMKIKASPGRVFKAGNRPGRKRIIPGSLKQCSDCGEEMDGPEQLVLHWSLEHPDKEPVFKCAEEGCAFRTGDVEGAFKHRSRHSAPGGGGGGGGRTGQDRNEKCKVCRRSYPRSYLQTQHMRVHADSIQLSCCVCNKQFQSVEELKAHSLSHVPDEHKYVHCCELCGKRFTQRANLEAHLRVHSGFKPFSCEFCGKTFSQKGNMDEHKRTHTGEKPYVCETCGSAFVRRSELLLHVRCSHTGERPFQCVYCPKNFQRRDLLRKHERIHTDTRPYSCQYCHKSFTQRDKMIVHTRLHTGERPYVCDVCGKGFCESGNLKKHLRVHGKEIPKVVHQNNKGRTAPTISNSSKHLLVQGELLPLPSDLTSTQPQLDTQQLQSDGNQHGNVAAAATNAAVSASGTKNKVLKERQETNSVAAAAAAGGIKLAIAAAAAAAAAAKTPILPESVGSPSAASLQTSQLSQSQPQSQEVSSDRRSSLTPGVGGNGVHHLSSHGHSTPHLSFGHDDHSDSLSERSVTPSPGPNRLPAAAAAAAALASSMPPQMLPPPPQGPLPPQPQPLPPVQANSVPPPHPQAASHHHHHHAAAAANYVMHPLMQHLSVGWYGASTGGGAGAGAREAGSNAGQ